MGPPAHCDGEQREAVLSLIMSSELNLLRALPDASCVPKRLATLIWDSF